MDEGESVSFAGCKREIKGQSERDERTVRERGEGERKKGHERDIYIPSKICLGMSDEGDK